jgi:hypothetical protein
MSRVSRPHRPFSCHAVPIRETPSGPGKASGNMVRTVAVKGMGKLRANRLKSLKCQAWLTSGGLITAPLPLREKVAERSEVG